MSPFMSRFIASRTRPRSSIRRFEFAGLLGSLWLVTLVSPAPVDGFGLDQSVLGSVPVGTHFLVPDSKGDLFLTAGRFIQRFDQESITWQPAQQVLQNGGNRSTLSIATDCFDRLHLMWRSDGGSTNPDTLYYCRRDSASGPWGPNFVLDAGPDKYWNFESGALETDKNGIVYAMWSRSIHRVTATDYYDTTHVFVRLGDPAGFWISKRKIHTIEDDAASFSHACGIIPQSDVHYVKGPPADTTLVMHTSWHDFGPARYRAIQFSLVTGQYSDLTPVTEIGWGDAWSGMAVACDTMVHFVSTSTGSHPVHSQGEFSYPFDGPASFQIVASTTLTGTGVNPGLAVDGLGNVHLAYFGETPDEFELYYTRWSAKTETWSAPEIVSDAGAITNLFWIPEITTDGRGGAHVVWQTTYDRAACASLPVPTEAAGDAPKLAARLSRARAAALSSDLLPVIIDFKERAPLSALSRTLSPKERAARAIADLRAVANASQAQVRSELAAAVAGGHARDVRPLWIKNSIGAWVAPDLLDALASRPEVEKIVYDPPREAAYDDAPLPRSLQRFQTPPARALQPMTNTPTPRTWNVDWVKAPQAWDLGARGQSIIVAILDSGVDTAHVDLANRLWKNPGETWNGIDDDGNGKTDDVSGYDFDARTGSVYDDDGHGTIVAGIVAGDGTGGTITGVAPEASIMPLRVAAYDTRVSTICEAVEYAVAEGARVLNLSFGFPCLEFDLRAEFRDVFWATAQVGVIVCKSAGNDRCERQPPGSITAPGDVPPPWLSPDQDDLGELAGATTVGALSHTSDLIASFSSRGPVDWSQVGGYEDWQLCGVFPSGLGLIKPDVCAPGERVQSTRLGGLYTGESEDGTSFAAPHVAGLAALILSFEDQLSTSLVHSFIEGQAVDLGPFGKDNGYGSGKIDCEASVAATTIVLPDLYDLESHTLFDASGGNGDGRMDAGETAFLGMEIHNNGAAPIQRVRARLETASPFVTVLDDSVFLGDLAPDSTLATGADRFEIEILPNAPEGRVDTFYVRLSGFSSNGSVSFADTLHNPNSVGVPAPPPAILRLGLAVRPNPARGEARLSLELPSSCRAKVVIHDVQGRALRTLTDGWMTGGRQELSWDGRDDRGRRLGAGLYFARCSSNSGAIGRRFVMLGR